MDGPLAGNSKRAHVIFCLFYILIYFLKYETIVSRNGLSLGYSEQDTSSVCLFATQEGNHEISFSWILIQGIPG